MSTLTQKEPIAVGAAVTMLVNAVLLVLASFHVVTLDAEQTAAIFAAANAVTTIVVAIATRRIVVSPAGLAAGYTPVLPGSAEDTRA